MIPSLVSIIVLNWHSKNSIEACVESLLQQSYSHREIILVDNASQDGSLELLRSKYHSRISIIQNERNLGFAEGVNTGIRSSQGEFIALLNADATAHPDWLQHLVSTMTQSLNIGMCTSKIYLTGKDRLLDNVGSQICMDGLGRAKGRMEPDQGQFDHLQEALSPSGCAGFYRRKMLEEIGGFDSSFFAYMEDVDMGLQGHLLGYENRFVPQAVAHHQLSSSAGLVSTLKAYYVERNRLWVVIKCFPMNRLLLSFGITLQRFFFILMGMFRRQGPAAQFAKESNGLLLGWILIKGYLSTLYHLPQLLQKRSEITKKKKISNREFETLLRRFEISPKEAALQELN